MKTIQKNVMKTRYELTPQMREYDKIGQNWLPYLMFFHAPDYSSDVLNTDSRGFRISYKQGSKIEDFGSSVNQSKSIFVGGSSAFGVGATHDRYTIPSILNSLTDEVWLNFGGRAFNSTQELLLFLFYHQKIKDIKQVVIFSGLNNIAIYYLSGRYSRDLGSFFFSTKYNKAMSEALKSKKRRVAEAVLRPVLGNRLLENPSALPVYKENKEDILPVFARDISTWKMLSDSLGFTVHYVLQPMANWIEKEPSNEERILFEELDKMPQNVWKIMKDKMDREQYKWFLPQIRQICESNKIHFFDMNKAISRRGLHGRWLYVDRGHFTDEGNRVVAEILKEEVIGK